MVYLDAVALPAVLSLAHYIAAMGAVLHNSHKISMDALVAALLLHYFKQEGRKHLLGGVAQFELCLYYKSQPLPYQSEVICR